MEARLLSGRASFDADSLSGVDTLHRRAVERVIVKMRERVDSTLPLGEMADIAHLSPYHFARTFRRVTGVPPGEFLCALRLERAKELLLTTDLGVSEVCFEVGYNSPGTFATRFKQLVGIRPGRIRSLPEELASALEAQPGVVRDLPGPIARDTGVAFRVGGSGLGGALIFVGLFPGAVPQRRPVACALLTAPGAHVLAPVPDGLYHLMAAALPFSGDPSGLLLPGAALRVGRSEGLLQVYKGRADGLADVALRPMRATDPPVLVALPALLLERLAPDGPLQRAR